MSLTLPCTSPSISSLLRSGNFFRPILQSCPADLSVFSAVCDSLKNLTGVAVFFSFRGSPVLFPIVIKRAESRPEEGQGAGTARPEQSTPQSSGALRVLDRQGHVKVPGTSRRQLSEHRMLEAVSCLSSRTLLLPLSTSGKLLNLCPGKLLHRDTVWGTFPLFPLLVTNK